jgi:very-short-patch-repair endonuclease
MPKSPLVEIALEYAGRQHGVVSRRQLMWSGVPSSTIAGRNASGCLFTVYPGVYAVGRPQLSWNGMLKASLLAAGEGSALGFRTAATVWGFMDFRRTVEIVRPKEATNFRAREKLEGDGRKVSIHVRRIGHLPESDVTFREGLALTSVSRTLLDLASVLTAKGFERAFLEADRLGLIADEELLALVPYSRGRKGGSAYRDLADRRLPEIHRARSLLEAIFLKLAKDSGLPMPEVNQTVSGYEVDFLWREARVIVELDGFEYHRGEEAWQKDIDRSNTLTIEKWHVRRFTWNMVNNRSEWVFEVIRHAFEQAGWSPPSESSESSESSDKATA